MTAVIYDSRNFKDLIASLYMAKVIFLLNFSKLLLRVNILIYYPTRFFE